MSTLNVTATIRIPLDEFEWSYARSSGPGGQNVNKVNSKVVLRWLVLVSPSISSEVRARFVERFANRLTTEGELVLSSETYRDQKRNVEDCLQKLSDMLRSVAARPRVRKPTKPTKSSQRRRLADKQRQSDKKSDRRGPPTE